jgi:nucleoside-diphosphate-sugar epimerase
MRALVTGGAGFIGSSLATSLVEAGHEVRVLDDLSTGYRENIPEGAELVEGDVADAEVVGKAMEGVDHVFHLAAHRAVLRSVNDPVSTDRANTHGTLLVLKAALDAGARRVVYSSSSSVYGGATVLPTPESTPLAPRSPYAVTKLAGEHYCRVFAELYGLETASLRYFNVYGPRQRPDSAYAAVVPLFIEAVRTGEAPIVHGDGLQSRSFTYIDDVVAANLAASAAPAAACSGQAYNIAGAATHSVLDILHTVARVLGADVTPVHTEPRAGDVRHTWGDPTAAAQALGYRATIEMDDGMARTVAWFAARAG